MVEQTSPLVSGGSTPTSPLHLYIKQITPNEMRTLVTAHHYLGQKRFRSSVCYGLFVGGNLAGGIAFHSVSAPETVVGAFGLSRNNQKGIWEIGRLVFRPEYNGTNYGSFLIGKSIRFLRKLTQVRAIITYAEAPRHNGGIYRASNFMYCGLTTPKKDFYVNGVKQERGRTKNVVGGEWRPRPQKHRYVMVFDKTLQLKWSTIPFNISQ